MRKQNIVLILFLSAFALLCGCIFFIPEESSEADTSREPPSADITKKTNKLNTIPFLKETIDNLSIDKIIENNSIYVLKKTTHYTTEGKVDWLKTNSLDPRGNVTKIIYIEPNDSEYDSDKVITIEQHSDFTDKGYPQTVKTNKDSTTYTYTEKENKLIEEAKPVKASPTITTYEFYPTGVLKSKTEEKRDGDKKSSTVTTTTYDEQGYISSYSVTGDTAYAATYTWVFDAVDNPIEYTKDIEDSTDDEFYWVENDGHGNIASINNPEDGSAIYEFEYQKILEPSDAAFVDAMTKEI